MLVQPCQRQEKRVIGPVQVTCGEIQSFIYNLSVLGIAFDSPQCLESLRGHPILVTLDVPRGKKYPKGMQLNLIGDLKYSRFDAGWNAYIVGLEYQKLSKTDQTHLIHLVQTLDQMNMFWGERFTGFE